MKDYFKKFSKNRISEIIIATGIYAISISLLQFLVRYIENDIINFLLIGIIPVIITIVALHRMYFIEYIVRNKFGGRFIQLTLFIIISPLLIYGFLYLSGLNFFLNTLSNTYLIISILFIPCEIFISIINRVLRKLNLYLW